MTLTLVPVVIVLLAVGDTGQGVARTPGQEPPASAPRGTLVAGGHEDQETLALSRRRSRRDSSSPEWKADAPAGAVPPTQGQWRHPDPNPGGGGAGAGGAGGGVGFEAGLGEGNVSVAYRHVSLTMDNFPDPRLDPRRCRRPRPSTVCDPLGVLSEAEALKLDNATLAICTNTGCPCHRNCSSPCSGFKVGVAVIPTAAITQTDQNNQNEVDEVKLWANHIRTHSWKLGTCADEVVVLLAVDEKKVFLSVGDRAKVLLDDACAESVIQDAKHHLVAGRFGDTLNKMLKDIKSVFDGDFKCELSYSQVMSTGKVIGIIFASVGPVVLIVVILVFLGPCFRGRGFGGSTGSKNRSYYRRGYAQAEMALEGTMPPARGAAGRGVEELT